jgi:multidrug resistance efflux pump
MVLQSINAAWYQPLVGLILQSVALPLLAIVPIVTRLWLRGMVKSQGTARPAYGYVGDGLEGLAPGTQARERGLGQQRDLDTVGAPARRPATEYWPSIAPIIIWAVVLAVAVAVAFVPYPYEAGGSFSILPNDKIQLNARIQGELTEVLVNEGDWVKPGQLMGVLSDWDQRYNLESARAQLENAKANLQTLFEMPRPEDIELARKQYEAALAKLPYDKAQYDRYASLVRNDTVSRSNYDQVLSIYQQDQAAADVARANYNQVRAGATPSQIEQARALVRQYTAAVAYYEDQLERTRIRATSAGRVVTQNPQLLRGQWFNPNVPNGALVFTVEDQHIVQADVYVPETDIDHVRVGGAVRARPWGYPKDIFPGKVVSIAPDAQPDPGGGSSNVIRVRTEIPNPDGRLHPTMAGYAKLTGVYLPTWESFMQMIIRFFMVEIWSWIP